MTTIISKPYPHGPNRYRCRAKTPQGWKWLTSADSPEAATLFAQNHASAVDPSLVGAQEFGIPQKHANISRSSNHLDISSQESEGLQSHDASGSSGVRVEGPYEHRSGWRCRLISSAGRQWAATGKTEAQALKLAEAATAKLAKQGQMTVKDALASYLRYKEKTGARPATLVNTRGAVMGLFRGAPAHFDLHRGCPPRR